MMQRLDLGSEINDIPVDIGDINPSVLPDAIADLRYPVFGKVFVNRSIGGLAITLSSTMQFVSHEVTAMRVINGELFADIRLAGESFAVLAEMIEDEVAVFKVRYWKLGEDGGRILTVDAHRKASE